MSAATAAGELLDREFLEMRAKVLELAASLDRLERASGDVSADRRLSQLHQALEILSQKGRSDRAENVQLLFSRDYDARWRDAFRLTRTS